jgi:integrase
LRADETSEMPRGDDALAWITSHNFRKTAATVLDGAGLTAREIADRVARLGRP